MSAQPSAESRAEQPANTYALRHLDNGLFPHEQAIVLFDHVWRLTAPNPSVMTGAGTNTYLVGDSEVGFWVIDPGSWRHDTPEALALDQAHVARIVALTQGQVHGIVCTHSHPDHSPAAVPLQALLAANGHARPPIYGMASADTAKANSFFRPEHALVHGDELALGEGASPRYALQAIYTPGHAANHLCFYLAQGQLLFCGDHVLGGTTTVVIPPDGDMEDYLRSLDVLEHCCMDQAVVYMLPAHGHVLAQPEKVLRNLRGHRLRKEAVVLQAIEAQPQGALDDWLDVAYGGLPAHLLRVARHTLRAHALRIAALHPHLAEHVQRALRQAPE